MDPLSMAASIVAVIQLASTIISSINDIKDAAKEQLQIATEISNVNSLLTPLKSRIAAEKLGSSWFATVQKLADKDGPLEQFDDTLKLIKAKVANVDRGFRKAVGMLAWGISKKEVAEMIARIERLKVLVILALANDTL